MSILPDSISCKVLQKESPVENVLIMAKFHTNYKNDHEVLSPLTNKGGLAIFSIGYIETNTENTCNNFIMDYGTLSKCFANKIDLEIMTPENLNKCLGAYHMYGKDFYRKDFKKDLDKAIKAARIINYEELFLSVEIMPKDLSIVLTIKSCAQQGR